MTTELAAGGINKDYGSTQTEEEFLVVGIPGAMMDRTPHHTSSHKQPRRPSSWKTKKFVVLGIIGGMAAAVVVATLFWSDLGDSYVMVMNETPYDNIKRKTKGTYRNVMVMNRTPYDVKPLSRLNPTLQYTSVGYLEDFYCRQSSDYYDDPGILAGQTWTSSRRVDYYDDPGILAGQTWTSSRRGLCLVNKIVAVVSLPDRRGVLQCTNYVNEQGTADSVFYIRMGGGDGCCVLKYTHSLGLLEECGPKQTYVHNPDYDYNTE